MSADDFEALTRALLDKEPGVTRADLYHTRFDAQYGIDAFAETPDGLIVASAKCYARIKRGDMAKWSLDFLKHWDGHWRTQNVRRFVLVTSAPMHHRKRLEDLKAERNRFAVHGLNYEVWSPNQLLERLRGHHGLVSQYLGFWFVEPLCGVQPIDTGDTTAAVLADVRHDEDLAAFEALFFESVTQRADSIAERIDLGHAEAVAGEVQALRDQPMWARLPRALQARIVRLQVSVALNAGDVDGAERYEAEASAIAAADEPRLKATITLRRQGVDAALLALGSPTTEKGRALRAGLLFASNDHAGASALVETLADDDPEKHRLRAYGALLSRDLVTARDAVQAGLDIAPESVAVRRMGAMIAYAQALSPLAPVEHLHYPMPVSVAFVRQDDEARALLAQAYETFTALGPVAGVAARHLDQAWRLACLGNLRDRTRDATELAATLLSERPRDVLAIAWSRARGLDVDLTASRLAVRTALFSGDIDENEVRALDWLTEESQAAALVIDLDALVARGGWSPEVETELVALRDRLSGGGESEAGVAVDDVPGLTAALERVLASSDPNPMLLALGEALAAAGAWTALAPALDRIEAFETADALRLATFVAYHAQDLLRAQDILRRAAAAFPGARLPVDLRRLESRVLVQTGQPQAGVARAADLAKETGEVRDRLLEARLHVENGQLTLAAAVLDGLLARETLDAHTALAWADKLSSEAPRTAVALWRSAAQQPMPDEIAVQAYLLSFTLGLDGEGASFAPAAARLAQQAGSGIEVVELDGIREIIRHDQERLAEIDRLWTGGLAPIHAVSGAARVSLAELLHLEAETAQRLRPIFLRSGAPGQADLGGPLGNDRLLMDVTALLMADQLGLLDVIERATRPYVGASTIEALLAMETRVRHPQPRRAQSARAIIGQVGRGVNLLAPENALRVTHEPVEGEIDVEAVIAGLRASESADALAGRALVFAELTLSTVAEADLLDAAIARFDVYIEAGSLEMARDEVSRADRGEVLLGWVSRLRERVSDGIVVGRYNMLPPVPSSEDDRANDQPLSRNLLELLRAAEAGDARIWIDDRAISSFTHFGGARVLGAFDVLELLLADGRIDTSTYYDKVLQLRAGGVVFLPLSAEEVVRHIAHANVVDGVVQETRELRILRRYVGLCLRYQDELRIRPTPGALGERPSELPFAIALRNLVRECVAAVWATNVPIATAQARSEWIWRALRSEQVPQPQDAPPITDNLFFGPLNFGELIAAGVTIGAAAGDTPLARRAAYLGWIAATVGSRFEIDPALARESGDYARLLLRADKEAGRKLSKADRKKWRRLVALTVQQLPSPMIEAIATDKQFLRDLGLDVTGVVGVGAYQFSGGEFWSGVTQALATGSTEVQDLTGSPVPFRRLPDVNDGLAIRLGETTVLSDGVFGVLLPDPAMRADALERQLVDLDVPASERDEVRAQVAAAEAPDHVVRIMEELRERSVPWFLGRVEALIAAGGTPLNSFEPPPAADWLRYLRWAPGAAVGVTAERLVAEVGVDEAAVRLSGLPIALPVALSAAAGAFDPTRATPLGLIHRLRARRDVLAADSASLAADVDLTVQGGAAQGQVFVAALRWAARSFEHQELWPELSAAEQHAVVWSFADRLTAVVARSLTNPSHFAEWLGEQAGSTAIHRSQELRRGYDDTVLRAGVMSDRGILLAGLEYALGEAADHLDLSREQLERLGATVALRDDAGVLHPPPERARSAECPFETWLVRPNPDAVVEGAGQIEAALIEAVSSLALKPYRPETWQFLRAFGRPALAEELREKLDAAVSTLDLSRLVAGADDPQARLHNVGEVAGRLASPGVSDAVLNGLLALSRTWLGLVGEAAFEDRLHALIEAAAGASRSYEGDGRQRLSRFLIALLGARPEAAAATLPILDRLVDLTPVREARPFWRALVAARTY